MDCAVWANGDQPPRRSARGCGQLQRKTSAWFVENSWQSSDSCVGQLGLARESEDSESSEEWMSQAPHQQAKVEIPDTQRLGNLNPWRNE